MKRFMLACLMLSLVVSAGSVEELLLHRMADSHPDDQISVVIHFESPDMDRLRTSVGRDRDNLADFKIALMNNADMSQIPFLASVERQFPMRNVRRFWLANVVTATVPAGAVMDIAARPDVKSVSLEKTFDLVKPVKSDSMQRDSNVRDDVYALQKMNVYRAWQELGLSGAGVRVGVVDSGINRDLDFVKDRLVMAKNFVNGAFDDNVVDNLGHGTHVSGTIVGGHESGDLWGMLWGMFPNKIGTFSGRIGVAPAADLWFAKVMESGGSFSDILSGLQWLANPDGNPATDDGMHVINGSLGASQSVPELREPLVNLQAMGTFLVFAAGNSGRLVGSPADFPEVFAVGATNSSDVKASFSSIGPSKYDGKDWIKPEVVAPGVKIISYYGNRLFEMDGTSMAAPNVTGVIALMLEANPNITHDEIRAALKNTALDLGTSGPNNQYGWGRVDAYAAARYVSRNAGAMDMLNARLTSMAKSSDDISAVQVLMRRISSLIAENQIPRGDFESEAYSILPEKMQSLVGTIWLDAESIRLWRQMSR